MSKIDLTGQKFGRLTVLRDVGRSPAGNVLWQCLCRCGNTKVVDSKSLRRSGTKSCGCLHSENGRRTGRKNTVYRLARPGGGSIEDLEDLIR